MTTMNISSLGTTFSITFRNTGCGDELTTWVCETVQVYREQLEDLRKMSHIEILHHGQALVYKQD